jgi:beta-1,4-mannosyltransferase
MRIAFLPLAGPQNPYQLLMVKGLEQGGHQLVAGCDGAFFALTRTVLTRRPQAVHLDWPAKYYLRRNLVLTLVQSAFFYLDLLLFRLTGTQLVWTAHNLVEHDIRFAWLDKWAKRRLAATATKVRIFAEGQREAACHAFGIASAKIVTVPEGSYLGYYAHTQSQQDARYLLGLPPYGRVVLHFGNLRPYKGSVKLVEAFCQVAGPTDSLVLAGPAHNPAYVQAIAAAAKGDVRVVLRPGFVEAPQVQTYFMAADVAAFPFERIDNSGTVILAMGFGLVCVAPKVGAVSARLSAQQAYLFAPGGLAQALQKALAAPKAELQELGALNRRQVASFNWEDFAPVFDAL